MSAIRSLLSAVVLCAASTAAFAQGSDPYQITQEERSACLPDATRYCSNAYPDPDKLLECMKASRPYLSPYCLAVFDEGLRHRGL